MEASVKLPPYFLHAMQEINGYVRIQNDLFDALVRLRIPGEARQVFDCIIRKTLGYNKRRDQIALSQFVNATGLTKHKIIEAVKKLEKMNLLVTQKGNEKGNFYQVNANFSAWKPLPKKVTLPKKVMSVTQKGNLPLPKKVPTKDNMTKDNNIIVDVPASLIAPQELNDKFSLSSVMRLKAPQDNLFRAAKFVRPTLDEVAAYCKERKNDVDPEKWMNHYESNGWKVGKNPMKNWQAAVRTWERNQKPYPKGDEQAPPTKFKDAKEIVAQMQRDGIIS